MCFLYLQFLLLLGLPLPDNVLYSCFPCCFLLRSLGRDSYRLLTGANWLLGSAVRQSIGAFRDTSRCICPLLLDDSLYRCFSPRFLRRYADLHTVMTDAVGRYVADVKSQDFPNEQEQY